MIALTLKSGATAAQQLMVIGITVSNPSALLKVLERVGQNALQAHFRDRDQIGNKLGGRRTHFWQQMADSLRSSQSGTELKISITDPRFNQKVYGGVIKPKHAKALTIPVNPSAHGITAGKPMLGPFQDPNEDGTVGWERATGQKLFVITWKSPKGNSIGALCTKSDPHGKFFEVVFLLVTRVRQAKDPHALPDQAAFRQQLTDAANRWVARTTNPGGTTP